MTLGSLIFKEESGYYSFYHRLLRPLGGSGDASEGHYLPVWKQGPEDVLGAIKWARQNDEKAREAAERSRELAMEVFTPMSLDCYWLVLFERLAPLLKYKVGGEDGSKEPRYRNLQPVETFLDSQEGRKYTLAGDLRLIEL